MEDAALLRPPGTSPLVFTVDFITPVVDDPETFGAIAAANAISDVYAMGGDPRVALAVGGFPRDVLSLEVIEAVFRGGRDKAAEAGCAIVGGHTVVDPELKYGLCVIGEVASETAFTQTAARPGDVLVLTKPVGTGIASQAAKKGGIEPHEYDAAVASMGTLNRVASEVAREHGVRAATDVTGFGLLGHLHHLLDASGVSARLSASAVPAFGFAERLAGAGIVPGGSRRNLNYVNPHVRWDDSVSEARRLILADAQTSGGLLLAVPPERSDSLVRGLKERGSLAQAVIGEVEAGVGGRVQVDP